MQLVVEVTQADIRHYSDEFLRWPIDRAVERVVQTWRNEAAPHYDNPDLDIRVSRDSLVIKREKISRRYPLPEIAKENIGHVIEVEEKIHLLQEEVQRLKETLTPCTFTLEVDDDLFIITPCD